MNILQSSSSPPCRRHGHRIFIFVHQSVAPTPWGTGEHVPQLLQIAGHGAL